MQAYAFRSRRCAFPTHCGSCCVAFQVRRSSASSYNAHHAHAHTLCTSVCACSALCPVLSSVSVLSSVCPLAFMSLITTVRAGTGVPGVQEISARVGRARVVCRRCHGIRWSPQPCLITVVGSCHVHRRVLYSVRECLCAARRETRDHVHGTTRGVTTGLGPPRCPGIDLCLMTGRKVSCLDPVSYSVP